MSTNSVFFCILFFLQSLNGWAISNAHRPPDQCDSQGAASDRSYFNFKNLKSRVENSQRDYNDMLDAVEGAFEDGVEDLYQKQADVIYFLGKYNASNKDGFNWFLEEAAMKSSKAFVTKFIRQHNKMFSEVIGEVKIEHWTKSYFPCKGLFNMTGGHYDSFTFKDIASHDFFSKFLVIPFFSRFMVHACFLQRKDCMSQVFRFRPKIRGKKLNILDDWADASANPDIETERKKYMYSVDQRQLERLISDIKNSNRTPSAWVADTNLPSGIGLIKSLYEYKISLLGFNGVTALGLSSSLSDLDIIIKAVGFYVGQQVSNDYLQNDYLQDVLDYKSALMYGLSKISKYQITGSIDVLVILNAMRTISRLKLLSKLGVLSTSESKWFDDKMSSFSSIIRKDEEGNDSGENADQVVQWLYDKYKPRVSIAGSSYKSENKKMVLEAMLEIESEYLIYRSVISFLEQKDADFVVDDLVYGIIEKNKMLISGLKKLGGDESGKRNKAVAIRKIKSIAYLNFLHGSLTGDVMSKKGRFAYSIDLPTFGNKELPITPKGRTSFSIPAKLEKDVRLNSWCRVFPDESKGQRFWGIDDENDGEISELETFGKNWRQRQIERQRLADDSNYGRLEEETVDPDEMQRPPSTHEKPWDDWRADNEENRQRNILDLDDDHTIYEKPWDWDDLEDISEEVEEGLDADEASLFSTWVRMRLYQRVAVDYAPLRATESFVGLSSASEQALLSLQAVSQTLTSVGVGLTVNAILPTLIIGK